VARVDGQLGLGGRVLRDEGSEDTLGQQVDVVLVGVVTDEGNLAGQTLGLKGRGCARGVGAVDGEDAGEVRVLGQPVADVAVGRGGL
jgi:hypothetical protein